MPDGLPERAARARHAIYATLAATGSAPTRAALAANLDIGEAACQDVLEHLHAAHLVVLDASDRRVVRMALPFAGQPTPYGVAGASGAWWANCAWDALAIARLLELDAARIVDAGDALRAPRTLEVAGGELVERDGLVHFAIPARRWWDDIALT